MYRRGTDLTHEIIGAAMEVHSEMGAGLIEQICENALCFELPKRGIRRQKQVPVPVQYKGEAASATCTPIL